MDLFDNKKDRSMPFELPNEDGYSMTWNENLNGYDIKIPNGVLFYSEHFFDQKISDRSVEYFLENTSNIDKSVDWRAMSAMEFSSINFENIKWKHDSINLYGKNIPLPRYTSWYGDPGKSYSYSGINSNPNEWNKGLLYIKKQIEKVVDINFNSVLLNWYRDGRLY